MGAGLLVWVMAAWGMGGGGCELTASSRAAGGTSRPVALLIGPQEDPGSLLEAIRAARRRVDLEMYMLTAPEALAALIDAHASGVEVRVLLEPAPYGDVTANEGAFTALSNAGIEVRWTHRAAGFVHAKMIIIDGQVVCVLTLNLTSAGLRGNREYATIDDSPADVRWAERVWSADALGAEPAPASFEERRLLVSPIDARARLSAAIADARTAIFIEMEELSDMDLAARLIAARERGVAVTVVAPALNRSLATNLTLARLAAAGVRVRTLLAPAVHAKAMVTDAARVYVGSINFTRASLDDNREVGLLWSDVVAAGRIRSTIAADAAAGMPFQSP